MVPRPGVFVAAVAVALSAGGARAQPCAPGGSAVRDPILAQPRCAGLALGLDGEHREWHPDGALRRLLNAAGGRLDGACAWYAIGGWPLLLGAHRAGRRHGVWTAYDGDGRPMLEGTYLDGKPEGRWRVRLGGEVQARTFSAGVDGSQCPAGTTLRSLSKAPPPADDSGDDRSDPFAAPQDPGWVSFCIDAAGRPHGPVREWLGDGQPRIDGAYDAGRKHGAWRVWLEPDVWEDQTWDRGARQGRWRLWARGVVARDVSYAAGLRDGPTLLYAADGTLVSRVAWADGRPHGSVEAWHDSGAPAVRGAYVRGARDGDWTAWLQNGQERRRGSYAMGTRIGAWIYWYDNGNLYLAGDYDGGRKEGLWRQWHANGGVARVGACHLGNAVGPWEEWDETGRKQAPGAAAGRAASAWDLPCAELPLIETEPDVTADPWDF